MLTRKLKQLALEFETTDTIQIAELLLIAANGSEDNALDLKLELDDYINENLNEKLSSKNIELCNQEPVEKRSVLFTSIKLNEDEKIDKTFEPENKTERPPLLTLERDTIVKVKADIDRLVDVLNDASIFPQEKDMEIPIDTDGLREEIEIVWKSNLSLLRGDGIHKKWQLPNVEGYFEVLDLQHTLHDILLYNAFPERKKPELDDPWLHLTEQEQEQELQLAVEQHGDLLLEIQESIAKANFVSQDKIKEATDKIKYKQIISTYILSGKKVYLEKHKAKHLNETRQTFKLGRNKGGSYQYGRHIQYEEIDIPQNQKQFNVLHSLIDDLSNYNRGDKQSFDKRYSAWQVKLMQKGYRDFSKLLNRSNDPYAEWEGIAKDLSAARQSLSNRINHYEHKSLCNKSMSKDQFGNAEWDQLRFFSEFDSMAEESRETRINNADDALVQLTLLNVVYEEQGTTHYRKDLDPKELSIVYEAKSAFAKAHNTSVGNLGNDPYYANALGKKTDSYKCFEELCKKVISLQEKKEEKPKVVFKPLTFV